MKKAVFFDIDGTIVSDDSRHVILDSTKSAFKKLHERGIYTAINTGRTYFNVNEDIKQLGFDGFICGCGTHIIYKNKELYYRTIEKEECEYIVRLVRESDAAVLYERRDKFFYDKKTRIIKGLQELTDVYKNQGKDISNETSDDDFSFDKFVIWYDKKTDLEHFKKGIEGRFDFISRGSGFAELVPCGCSKGKAAEEFAAYLGISRENTYAAGDSLNDLPMIQAVGNSISIGKESELYKYAAYAAGDFYSGGLSEGLEHFGLI